MGFYHENKYQTVLNFDNKGGAIHDLSFYSDGIELINNEDTIFDFTDYIQDYATGDILLEEDDILTPEEDVILIENQNNIALNLEADGFTSRDCLYKITIDCKDGNIITSNRNGKTSWLTITHKPYFITDEYYNLPEDDKSKWPTIDITLYNLYGFKSSIQIPFRLRKSSYTQSGIKLKLIAANITNDNKISYVFNDENNNQLILAKRD